MIRDDSEWYSSGFTKEWWLSLDADDRFVFLENLTDEELESFFRDWRVWARDKQLAPEGIWSTWLLLCGRGFGKTRSAVEFITDEVDAGRATAIAIVGQGEADIRRVMVEGKAGFLRCAKSWNTPRWYPSVGGGGELHWPNGAVGYVYSALDPESLRGPEFDFAWFDEPMAVPAAARAQTVYNLTMALRAGQHPRLLYTTTPKPHRWLHEQIAIAEAELKKPPLLRTYVMTKGSTFENEENLAPGYIRAMRDNYDGTTLGRQELYAELLGEELGAMWTPKILDDTRIRSFGQNDPMEEELRMETARSCEKVIVAVDPNITAGKASHAAGIIVCGKRGNKRFAIDDFSVRGQSPVKWATRAITAYQQYEADEIVAEINQGGDLVSTVVHQVAVDMGINVKVVKVRATKGKVKRAEPIAAAYERKLISHVGGIGNAESPGRLYALETQLCSMHDAFDPTGEDFDRADALVWGMTRLGVKRIVSSAGSGVSGIRSFGEFTNGQGAAG